RDRSQRGHPHDRRPARAGVAAQVPAGTTGAEPLRAPRGIVGTGAVRGRAGRAARPGRARSEPPRRRTGPGSNQSPRGDPDGPIPQASLLRQPRRFRGVVIAMRSFRHWTPTYIRDRLAMLRYELAHPDAPWLTGEMNQFLESWLAPDHVGLEFGSG